MGRQRLEVEFGRYLAWVVDAVRALPPEDRMPGACRGMGSPRFLRHATRAGRLVPGMALLDIGCGIGGPAQWFAMNGYRVIGADVTSAAVRGARTLFPDLPVVRSSWRFLPFGTHRLDAVTALGVLELVQDKAACLRETKRVLRPGGRAVIYDYFRCSEGSMETPSANRFVTHQELLALAAESGFAVRHDEPIDRERVATGPWAEVSSVVEQALTAAHAGDPDLSAARREKALFTRLCNEGRIAPRLMVLES